MLPYFVLNSLTAEGLFIHQNALHGVHEHTRVTSLPTKHLTRLEVKVSNHIKNAAVFLVKDALFNTATKTKSSR